jgi:hypothetical protein
MSWGRDGEGVGKMQPASACDPLLTQTPALC